MLNTKGLEIDPARISDTAYPPLAASRQPLGGFPARERLLYVLPAIELLVPSRQFVIRKRTGLSSDVVFHASDITPGGTQYKNILKIILR